VAVNSTSVTDNTQEPFAKRTEIRVESVPVATAFLTRVGKEIYLPI
jgi:hypothetical protein